MSVAEARPLRFQAGARDYSAPLPSPSILDRFRAWLAPAPKARAMPPPTARAAPKPIVGGVLPEIEGKGRTGSILSTGESDPDAIDALLENDPDGSLALQTFVTLVFSDPMAITVNRIVAGERTDEPDEAALTMIQDWEKVVARQYGGTLEGMAKALAYDDFAYSRSGAQVALAKSTDNVDAVLPLDGARFATLEGALVYRTKGRNDAPRENNTVPAEHDQVLFLPANPRAGRATGPSSIAAAIGTGQRVTRVYDSLYAIVRNNGYARPGMLLDYQRAHDAVMDALGANPDMAEYKRLMDGYLSQMESAAESMNPDSWLVIWDFAKPTTIGAQHSGYSLNADTAINPFLRAHSNALKTPGALLGRPEGGALSTSSDVEKEIYFAKIEQARATKRRFIEWAVDWQLRVKGVSGYAVVAQDTIDKGDALQEANALKAKQETYAASRDRGWVSDDEAANALFGHAAVSEATLVPSATEPSSALSASPTRARLTRRLAREFDAETTPDEVVTAWDRWARGNNRRFVGLMDATIVETVKRGMGGRATPDGWVYVTSRQQYRSPAGQYLTDAQLWDLMDERRSDVATRMREQGQRLEDGDSDVPEFAAAMLGLIVLGTATNRLLAVGGRNAMTDAVSAAIEAGVARQRGYLDGFVGEVREARDAGESVSAAGRAEKYAGSMMRNEFAEPFRAAAVEEQRHLGDSDAHCATCVEQADGEWHKAGELNALGDSECNGSCQCSFSRRQSEAP